MAGWVELVVGRVPGRRLGTPRRERGRVRERGPGLAGERGPEIVLGLVEGLVLAMARGSVPGSVPAKLLELVLAWVREQELESVLERVLGLVLELAAERIPAKGQLAVRVRMGCRI
jgi:hypothetical protein